MGSPPTVCVTTAQFYSHTDAPSKLQLCIKFMREAASNDAQLIVKPENSNRCHDFTTREAPYKLCEDIDANFVKHIQAAAGELGITIVIGVKLKG
jgi:predicted amidohydrolase